ncbi:hypothetical protein GCM10022252_70030 [Streptosporangium oxazolinicum]|uniref:Uncharacterized protein n=1 Tax=Streptosporangium oxazolinicum TaxID=909287 RepID=A0ABP8BHI9_9ACTN
MTEVKEAGDKTCPNPISRFRIHPLPDRRSGQPLNSITMKLSASRPNPAITSAEGRSPGICDGNGTTERPQGRRIRGAYERPTDPGVIEEHQAGEAPILPVSARATDSPQGESTGQQRGLETDAGPGARTAERAPGYTALPAAGVPFRLSIDLTSTSKIILMLDHRHKPSYDPETWRKQAVDQRMRPSRERRSLT